MEWYDNMKKKRIYVLLFLLGVLFTTGTSVKASTCTDDRIIQLSSLANDVKVSYQEYDKLIDEYDSEVLVGDDEGSSFVKHTYPAYYLTIYNLPDDLNVSVIRNDDKKDIVVYAKDKDKDGVIYIDTGIAGKVKMFTVKIRSNDSSCKNEVVKAVAVSTPMYNEFSTFESCQEYPEFELCKKYTSVDYSEITMPEFTKKLEEYKEKKIEEEKKQKSIFYNIGKFLSTYKWYIIIPIVIIGVALIVIYIIRRKKSRLV